MEVLAAVHGATTNKERFIKNYVITNLKILPGTMKDLGTNDKPSRLDNMKRAVLEHPHLFQYDGMKSGFWIRILASQH